MTISSNERAFFVAMGERITKLRKAHNLTQTQLAEALGVTQQTVQAYEAGSRRIPVSALPMVARTLSVSLMELFGEGPQQEKTAKRRRGPVPQWQQHIEAIAKLPRSRQQFVAEMLRNALGEEAAQ
ncbi:helix-turn-helix transcriptional regulator [Aquabacterium sp.]|mgnify:FL=1|uniref:helix-turn-helix domain-containing protein n=1 Tax=Aquabacterium TaxID=92793 RepID=UPI001D5115B2|nr:helix-turn-helix transcriptional regulator [Aquabacterium sp.]MBT9610465.1 helix-turn-helix transcriptional regulator [Aquabacterium sp.]|tara:strand:- start:2992 stop:3369 length:378 start_codon:yes stop_codon:yes gene_type:complete